MTPEEKLNAFLAADEAPAADIAFNTRLSQRLARHRLREQMARNGAISLAIAAIAYGVSSFAPDLVAQVFSLEILVAASVVGFGLIVQRAMNWRLLAPIFGR